MTSWLVRLGARGGPLTTAAARFLDTLDRDPDPDRDAPTPTLARGTDALSLLAKALDAHCDIETPSDEEDRQFVEGAGALLGAVLIDVLGGAGYAARDDGGHRVQIGTHGYVDPFDAIERALDADDPRAMLAAAIRDAEAEARGTGTASRVVVELERALAARRPDLAVRERLERYVRLEGGIEVDLARVVEATSDQDGAAVTQAVDKLVGMLGAGLSSVDIVWEEAAPLLVPRLVGKTFVRELAESGQVSGQVSGQASGQASGQVGAGLALFPLGHDVHIALLLAYGDRARYVRATELERFDRPATDVLARAVVNLAARSENARFARLDTPAGPMVIARSGDGLDAARLLLPTLHDVLAPELGSPFVVAVPHRDTLLACAEAPGALVEALLQRARDDAARAPHAICRELFRVSATGVTPV